MTKKGKSKKENLCPDCGEPLNPISAMNAISRTDPNKRICSDCGKKEGLMK